MNQNQQEKLLNSEEVNQALADKKLLERVLNKHYSDFDYRVSLQKQKQGLCFVIHTNSEKIKSSLPSEKNGVPVIFQPYYGVEF